MQDQFCRSLFCDITFVCDHTGTDTCKPCELGRDLGRGGCGDIYFEGKPSPVYQDAEALEVTCVGPGVSPPDDVFLGPLYEPPEG